jgi:hypothetical protein
MSVPTTQTPAEPWTDARNRLALETYADRLARHRDRLADDLDAAHLRIRWQAYERQACRQLTQQQVRVLTDAGVIVSSPDELDDRRLVQRRREQLAALSDLQRLVERAIEAHLPSGERSEGRA